MLKSTDYKRGYDAGYKQALLDALKDRQAVGQALQHRELKPRSSPHRTLKFGEIQ